MLYSAIEYKNEPANMQQNHIGLSKEQTVSAGIISYGLLGTVKLSIIIINTPKNPKIVKLFL